MDPRSGSSSEVGVGRGAPHLAQKRAPSTFGWLQVGHSMMRKTLYPMSSFAAHYEVRCWTRVRRIASVVRRRIARRKQGVQEVGTSGTNLRSEVRSFTVDERRRATMQRSRWFVKDAGPATGKKQNTQHLLTCLLQGAKSLLPFAGTGLSSRRTRWRSSIGRAPAL